MPLLDKLLKKGIDGTGTIMANRIRSVRFRSDSEMKQGDLDELTRNDEKVAIVKWKDSRMVLLASTCARATNAEPVKRWSKKEKCIDVPPPEVVRRYNASMGGVDTCDQLIEYYRVAVKTKKWTLKVSLHIVDLAIANCLLEYRDACRKDAVLRRNTMSFLDFRLAVTEALCASHKRKRLESNNENVQPNHSTERSPGAAKIPGVDKRLDSYYHWPSVDSLSSARCCRLAGCTLRTRTRCNVYLCLSSDKNGFKMFHRRH
nr:piggyBac transposable element-derived protein 3-like [Rhipicephalus microplus]